MIFEGLSDKLQGAFSKLKSKGKLTEVDVKNAMREVKLALLEADVNFKVVKDFIKKSSREMCWARSYAKLNSSSACNQNCK